MAWPDRAGIKHLFNLAYYGKEFPPVAKIRQVFIEEWLSAQFCGKSACGCL
jgi:hypothetical protein